MADYSEEFIKADNPWKSEDNFVCPIPEKLYDDKAKWLLKCDEEIVSQFNLKNPNNDYKYELGMRPEPFNGNPLKAKVIILSLNPGYVLRVNNLFAKVLQTTEPKDIQDAVKEQKDKQLRLEAESFFCQRNRINDELVSYREAHCMLDDWYWYDILSKFLNEANKYGLLKDFTLDRIFDSFALVQYIGYMSKSFKAFPKGTILPSQEFTKRLIEYLAENKPNVIFIVSRSVKEWNGLLGDKLWGRLEADKRLVTRKKFTDKNEVKRTIRTQGFGKDTFEVGGYKRIIEALTK